MFSWQVYNKSVSSQYFHNRNLWSAALWCLNVVRTGFSAPHLCLFIVCKFSTQSEEFPLIKTAKIKASTFSTQYTHFSLLEWRKPPDVTAASHAVPPVCIFIKITLNRHSLNLSSYSLWSASLWMSLLGNKFPAIYNPDSSRHGKGIHHHHHFLFYFGRLSFRYLLAHPPLSADYLAHCFYLYASA